LRAQRGNLGAVAQLHRGRSPLTPPRNDGDAEACHA
jgi:hypothetical protein